MEDLESSGMEVNELVDQMEMEEVSCIDLTCNAFNSSKLKLSYYFVSLTLLAGRHISPRYFLLIQSKHTKVNKISTGFERIVSGNARYVKQIWKYIDLNIVMFS